MRPSAASRPSRPPGLTTISPSNTRPALTDPARDATYAGYLRTAHSDAFQGKAAAEFAYNELGLKTAATIHDGSAYAQALQQVFADEFTKLGGTITTQEAVTKDQKDMTSVLKKIATSNAGAAPDLIYMPDFVAVAGYLSSQIPGIAGLENVKTMGADGHFTADYLKAAGKAADRPLPDQPELLGLRVGLQGLPHQARGQVRRAAR